MRHIKNNYGPIDIIVAPPDAFNGTLTGLLLRGCLIPATLAQTVKRDFEMDRSRICASYIIE